MKVKLDGKIKIQFLRLRTKTYSYLTGHGNEDEKAKDTKSCVIKRKIEFKDYKNSLEAIRK